MLRNFLAKLRGKWAIVKKDLNDILGKKPQGRETPQDKRRREHRQRVRRYLLREAIV